MAYVRAVIIVINECWKLISRLAGLKQLNIHTKFRTNWATGSKVETGSIIGPSALLINIDTCRYISEAPSEPDLTPKASLLYSRRRNLKKITGSADDASH